MDYFYCLTDAHGYVHSIDNLIVTYYVSDVGNHAVERLVDEIRALRDKHPEVIYWEKLGLNACRKYSFFQNAIHLDDGIYVLVGHYKDYDREKKEMYVFPMIRLEINPNKHVHKPVFDSLMQIIYKNCYDGSISRYDYAVDIPVGPDDVQVFGSNKEKGLYKGTRYYGQRNRNGFCRIYDKQKEQGLEAKLTRVEHVISCTKGTKNLSFERVYVKCQDQGKEKPASKTDRVIVGLCRMCQVNGLDYESILSGLDRRKHKDIMGYLSGGGYQRVDFDSEIHEKLLAYYKEYFRVKEPEEYFQVDGDGFLSLADGEELPFD